MCNPLPTPALAAEKVTQTPLIVAVLEMRGATVKLFVAGVGAGAGLGAGVVRFVGSTSTASEIMPSPRPLASST